MHIINIHERHIAAPTEVISELLKTLATKGDKIWPKETWPRMKLDKGLTVGSNGGHGPIRYYVKRSIAGALIEFQFIKPEGLHGVHRLEVLPDHGNTILKHTIDAHAKGKARISWGWFIKPLHDALIEDAFDKVENLITNQNKRTEWSPWVKFLRVLLK